MELLQGATTDSGDLNGEEEEMVVKLNVLLILVGDRAKFCKLDWHLGWPNHGELPYLSSSTFDGFH